MVVTDGYCPDCGAVAPLGDYARLVAARGGQLVVDDTQALGVLGAKPTRPAPHGTGGAGSLAFAGVPPSEAIVVVCSLAKGLGVPIAVILGSRRLINRLQASGPTRVHASPPSVAHLLAADRALRLHHQQGERRRQILAALVGGFRRRAALDGLGLLETSFPVQLLPVASPVRAHQLSRVLAGRGIRVVALQSRCRGGGAVGLLITARHRLRELNAAAGVLGQAVRRAA